MFIVLNLLFSWLPSHLSILIVASIILFVLWSMVKLIGAILDMLPFL